MIAEAALHPAEQPPQPAGERISRRFQYVLRLADANLILAQRLGELIGHAPAIEEDLGLGNIALDLLGQARLLLSYAGEIEGRGRSEDVLAFLREPGEFLNPMLVEQPNGDFGQTIIRQFLFDAWQLEFYERLSNSTDVRLAEIAAKGLKETRYHLRYSSNWVVRLGEGTKESHERAQAAVELLWPYTTELFAADELDVQMLRAGVAPELDAVRQGWDAIVNNVLVEAALTRPLDSVFRWWGKRGDHGEHLVRLLAEMQYMQRMYPGVEW
jgi:ring-1,2-phenylacetyl-CoA epoxidase subunit PaaC